MGGQPRDQNASSSITPGFGEYYQCHFKSFDIYSLSSLGGCWEVMPTLTESEALDRAIDFIGHSNFEELAELTAEYPNVKQSIQEILPIFLQREESALTAMASSEAEKKDN